MATAAVQEENAGHGAAQEKDGATHQEVASAQAQEIATRELLALEDAPHTAWL